MKFSIYMYLNRHVFIMYLVCHSVNIYNVYIIVQLASEQTDVTITKTHLFKYIENLSIGRKVFPFEVDTLSE